MSLIEADARTLLERIPDRSIDLVVTDPPYVFDRRGGAGINAFQEWFPELADEEWPRIFEQLYRVLRGNRHAYVFADRRVRDLFQAAAVDAGFKVRGPLIWDKLSIGPGGTWRPSYEFILWLTKGTPRRGAHRNRRDVLQAPRIRGGYPTEKPVLVLRSLIEQGSRPGELVLDPFCGSGNVGKAARELSRRCLLGDVDAAAAAARLRLAFVGLEADGALRSALRATGEESVARSAELRPIDVTESDDR